MKTCNNNNNKIRFSTQCLLVGYSSSEEAGVKRKVLRDVLNTEWSLPWMHNESDCFVVVVFCLWLMMNFVVPWSVVVVVVFCLWLMMNFVVPWSVVVVPWSVVVVVVFCLWLMMNFVVPWSPSHWLGIKYRESHPRCLFSPYSGSCADRGVGKAEKFRAQAEPGGGCSSSGRSGPQRSHHDVVQTIPCQQHRPGFYRLPQPVVTS